MDEYSEMAEILFEVSQKISDDEYVRLCNLLKKIKDKNEKKKEEGIIYIYSNILQNYYLNNNNEDQNIRNIFTSYTIS